VAGHIVKGGKAMAVTLDSRLSSEERADWTAKDLKALKQRELMDLYLTLPCPSMEEMTGEFRGDLLNQGSFWFIKNFAAYFALRAPLVNGKWQGKGFTTISDGAGHGYNHYLKLGKDKYILPMKTKIAASVFDGKDCFELDYTAYYSQAGIINMIDEVRRVNHDLYLGIGLWGYTKRQRKIPFFFSLSGPRRPFIGIDKQHRDRQRKFSRYA
jgi:hypothetical protein